MNATFESTTKRRGIAPKPYIHNVEFEDPLKWDEILGPMPEAACNARGLLTDGQTRHLARKMNFMRYQAIIYRDQLHDSDTAAAWEEHAREIRDALYAANYRLVPMVVKKFLAHPIVRRQGSVKRQMEYLTSFGDEGLMRGINAYDYSQYKLSTYASSCIYRWTVRCLQDETKQAMRGRSNADDMDFRFETKASGLRWEFYWDKVEEMLDTFLKLLNVREREIVTLRYLGGMTLEEIGKMKRITKERVRQIQNKAMDKLRSASNRFDMPERPWG